jgi:hypothetical protein
MSRTFSRRSLFGLKSRASERGVKRSGHCLAFFAELHHRVIVNREPIGIVRYKLQLDEVACEGMLRILRYCGGVPSKERIACIAMQDPGFDDTDIADICDKSVDWARECRAHREAIEQREVIPEELCWFPGHITKRDPTPEDIRVRCAEQRAKAHHVNSVPRSHSPAIRQWLLARDGDAPIFESVG